MLNKLFKEILAPKNAISPVSINFGSLKGSTPKIIGVIPRNIIIIPSVIISFPVALTFLVLRIITKSTTKPITIPATIPRAIESTSGRFIFENSTVTINAPNIPIVPWAKLIIKFVRNTIIIPNVASA